MQRHHLFFRNILLSSTYSTFLFHESLNSAWTLSLLSFLPYGEFAWGFQKFHFPPPSLFIRFPAGFSCFLYLPPPSLASLALILHLPSSQSGTFLSVSVTFCFPCRFERHCWYYLVENLFTYVFVSVMLISIVFFLSYHHSFLRELVCGWLFKGSNCFLLLLRILIPKYY